jgi:subtilisin family serine protease
MTHAFKFSYSRRLTALLSLTALVGCGTSGDRAAGSDELLAQDTEAARASVHVDKFLKSSDAIPGQYIVVLKDAELDTASVGKAAAALANQHGATITRTYSHSLRGFAMRASEAGARALAARPEVAYVEEDGKVSVAGTQTNPLNWGLDRIDEIDRQLDSSYSYSDFGTGVDVFIIDTGVNTSHPEFGGRASGLFTAINDGYGTNDCPTSGHGTHVAGIVAGSTYGVAKLARIHSVRVIGCNGGSISDAIAGVDRVTQYYTAVRKPSVANMSMRAYANQDTQALEDAVSRSIAAGITYVVGAGNDGQDACGFTPARVPAAITVGATNSWDIRWASSSGTSNYGPCLDLFAPGQDIVSIDLTARSGTSYAAPFVTGAAALYLEDKPGATPAQVATALVANAPVNKVSNAGVGSPTRLLYSNPSTSCGRLSSGQALTPGHTLYSCTPNTARLVHEKEGNVVVYDRYGALWSTNTSGKATSTFVMQTDGNLVLYPDSLNAIWNTGTGGQSGAYMLMQDDCNLVVYSSGGRPLWASNTRCR